MIMSLAFAMVNPDPPSPVEWASEVVVTTVLLNHYVASRFMIGVGKCLKTINMRAYIFRLGIGNIMDVISPKDVTLPMEMNTIRIGPARQIRQPIRILHHI